MNHFKSLSLYQGTAGCIRNAFLANETVMKKRVTTEDELICKKTSRMERDKSMCKFSKTWSNPLCVIRT